MAVDINLSTLRYLRSEEFCRCRETFESVLTDFVVGSERIQWATVIFVKLFVHESRYFSTLLATFYKADNPFLENAALYKVQNLQKIRVLISIFPKLLFFRNHINCTEATHI